MSDEFNEWGLSSGLDLDGAIVTVTEMEFGFNANIGADVVCANFTFETDEGEEIEQSFSVGQGWDPSRDGQELVSERPKNINKNTNFGILIQSVVDCIGDPQILGGSPRHASTWLGHQFKMGTVSIERLNPSTGETKAKDVFVVVEYFPEDDDSDDDEETEEAPKPAKKTAKAKSAAAKKPAAKKAKAESNGVPEGVDADHWKQLVDLAGQHEDHSDFADEALDLDFVDEDMGLQKLVISTKAGSVWAARDAS